MKFSAFAVLSFVSFALAAPTPEEQPPRFLLADIVKRAAPVEVRNLLKRGTVNTPLFNQLSFYQIDLQVGNPAQKLSALLDTGSSDMWFFSRNAGTSGVKTFDPSQSSTWHNNYTNFRIGYVSGDASGTWGTDDVSVSGAPLKQQSFAIVTSGNGLSGIPGLIGVGLPTLESTYVNAGFFQARRMYSNVPLNLFEQGHISTPTYSLFLDSVNADSGSILFGAVDHSKYTGQLYSVPRVHRSRFNINIDSISVKGQNVGSVGSATLDSGTTLGSLPDNVIVSLAQAMGLQQDRNTGLYAVRRGQVNVNTPISITISGVKFDFKSGDLLIDSDKLGDPFPKGLQVLGFTPASSTQNQVILGDVFLRNFYIVYDLAHPQIGIAKANFNHQGRTQMEAITGSTIPQAKVIAAAAVPAASVNNSPYAVFNPFRNLFGGDDQNMLVVEEKNATDIVSNEKQVDQTEFEHADNASNVEQPEYPKEPEQIKEPEQPKEPEQVSELEQPKEAEPVVVQDN